MKSMFYKTLLIGIMMMAVPSSGLFAQRTAEAETNKSPESNTLRSSYGSLTLESSGSLSANIDIQGTLELKGNWGNNRPNLNVEGEVKFISNPGQAISGTEISTFKDVTINPNCIVVLEEGTYINITGNFSNPNTSQSFVMEPGSSLIHSTPDVPGTVKNEIRGSEFSWHMLSSPVASQEISNGFDDGNFYAWHEPAQTWVSYTNTIVWPTWNDANNGTGFTPGKGYMTGYPFTGDPAGPQTKAFTGTMNQGQYAFTLQRLAHPDDTYEGFNMIGNPYPSSIDWKAPEGWSGFENLQTPDSSGYNIWIWNDAIDGGNYGAYNTNQTGNQGTLGVSRYIAPMQAFWVRAKNHNANLTMDDQVRVHSSQEWLKNGESIPNEIRLVVRGNANTYRDEIIVEYGHKNDRGGAEKMFGMYPDAPGLYSMKHNKNWSISFLTDIDSHPTVPLGFKAGADGIYTISLSGYEFFDNLFLEDLHTGIIHNLKEDASYHFNAGTNDAEGRFLLHFKAVGVREHYTQPPQIYFSHNILHVTNHWNTRASIQVYDANGRIIKEFDVPANGKNNTTLKTQAGIYLVRMLNNNLIFTEKIVVM